MFKRLFLLFGVNILIIAMGSLILSFLGVGHYRTAYGLDYQSLAIFCLVFGMLGAVINLMLSKFFAKMIYGVQVVDARGEYAWLVQTVHAMARKSGITKMPEVGIYQSPEMNAFATGPRKNNSLVAVSTGLLHNMNKNEIEGVLAHEVAHVANGDMVTMTLLQGVMNAFVMFLARVIAFVIDQFLRGDEEKGRGLGYFGHMMAVFVLEMIFGILASIVVAWFSRKREFRADAGGAYLAGRDNMIAALSALKRGYDHLSTDKTAMTAMQISSKGLMAALSSHPPLDDRIKALQRATSFKLD